MSCVSPLNPHRKVASKFRVIEWRIASFIYSEFRYLYILYHFNLYECKGLNNNMYGHTIASASQRILFKDDASFIYLFIV